MLKTLAMATTLAALLGAPVDVPATDLAAVTSERHDASLDRTTRAAQGPYSVVQGTIASSDRNGIELVLANGTKLTVPLSVRSVLHTHGDSRRAQVHPSLRLYAAPWAPCYHRSAAWQPM